jgi:WD40 repeat protein
MDLSAYPHILEGHTGQIEQLVFGPDGRFLVSNSTDGTVRHWPLPLERATGEDPRVLLDWGHPVEAVVSWMSLSRDGRFVVATGAESRARLVSVEDGSSVLVGESDQRILRGAAGPTGRTVAVVGVTDGHSELKIWDTQSGNVTGTVAIELDKYIDHAVTPRYVGDEGRMLVSFRGVLMERMPDGTMRSVAEPVGLFEASRDGRVVIARPKPDRSPPYEAAVFNLDNGHETQLTNHGQRVYSMAIDPTGTTVATGTFDGVVRVGKATGEMPHVFVVGGGRVPAVALSPDGRWVASGHEDGTIRLWPMPNLDERPLHTRPQAEFVATIKSLTNLRAVPNSEMPGEFSVRAAEAFTGWADL